MTNDILQGGLPEMTLSELKRCSLEQGGYETPELNDILYLHYKGYKKIKNLNRYTGLKALYLDSNGLDKIENIEHLSKLRCLFLNKNLIGTIENLGGLSSLVQLDLSDNNISYIQGLTALTNLATLNLSRNYLSNGASISHLKECSQNLTTVNLSFNQLRGQDVMMQLFGITSLVVLEMKENPIVRELSHFRKKCIVGMPKLRSLDSPIFDEERLSTEAWALGGREAEIRAKHDWKLEQNERNRQNLAKFREWKSNIQKKNEEVRQREAKFGPTEQKKDELKHAEQLRKVRLQRATDDSKREKEMFQITDINCITKQDGHTPGGEDIHPGIEIEKCADCSRSRFSVLADYLMDNEAKYETGEEGKEEKEETILQQSNRQPMTSEFADEKGSLCGSDNELDAENSSEPFEVNRDVIERMGLSYTYSVSSDNEPSDNVGLKSCNDNVGLIELYGISEKDASSFSMDHELKRADMERLIQDSLALLKYEKVHGRKVNSAYAAKSTWGDDDSDMEDGPIISRERMAEEKLNHSVSRNKCMATEGSQEGKSETATNGNTTTASIVHMIYKDSNGKQLSWEELEALPPRNPLSIFSNLPQAVVGIDDNIDEGDDGEVVLSTAVVRNRMLARLIAS